MLHHIEIYVSDLKQTRAFYDDLMPRLGYTLFQDWEGGFSYRDESGYIVFVQTADRFLPNGYHRCNIGLNHLAFRVESQETVDSLREHLLEKGVTLLYDDRYPFAGGEGHYALYFEDPDRIKLEVVWEEDE
ncbi:MAG: VOC family protein [Peptostreptococcaceae bacterium]|nr:VOC family protein [Peptostreptococcaceae bacterium]